MLSCAQLSPVAPPDGRSRPLPLRLLQQPLQPGVVLISNGMALRNPRRRRRRSGGRQDVGGIRNRKVTLQLQLALTMRRTCMGEESKLLPGWTQTSLSYRAMLARAWVVARCRYLSRGSLVVHFYTLPLKVLFQRVV